MKKLRQKIRTDEPRLVGIVGGTYSSPEPRITAFIWGDEENLDLVLTDATTAA
jgi:hypothetical protein